MTVQYTLDIIAVKNNKVISIVCKCFIVYYISFMVCVQYMSRASSGAYCKVMVAAVYTLDL